MQVVLCQQRHFVFLPQRKWNILAGTRNSSVAFQRSLFGFCLTAQWTCIYFILSSRLVTYFSLFLISLLIQQIMSLFVASHYKNSPNDLQLMADAPAHHLFVLLGLCPGLNIPDNSTLCNSDESFAFLYRSCWWIQEHSPWHFLCTSGEYTFLIFSSFLIFWLAIGTWAETIDYKIWNLAFDKLQNFEQI